MNPRLALHQNRPHRVRENGGFEERQDEQHQGRGDPKYRTEHILHGPTISTAFADISDPCTQFWCPSAGRSIQPVVARHWGLRHLRFYNF